MATELRIALFGATGRMGREIIESAARFDAGVARVVCGIAESRDAALGSMLPGIEQPIAAQWQKSFESAPPNVIIDFSSPEATKMALQLALERRIPILIGTTGLPAALDDEFKKVGAVVPVVRAGNTSVGINSVVRILESLTAMLGPSYDVEIVETHHNKKKDAPSGTALMLGEPVAKARGVKLKDVMVAGREGLSERKPGEIGFASLRGGNIVGDHSVVFYGPSDVIEVRHHAAHRSLFSDGAIRAAAWLVNAQKSGKTGLFSMQDVLGAAD